MALCLLGHGGAVTAAMKSADMAAAKKKGLGLSHLRQLVFYLENVVKHQARVAVHMSTFDTNVCMGGVDEASSASYNSSSTQAPTSWLPTPGEIGTAVSAYKCYVT
ncbi:hypothetical protein PF004_g9588 [Phytophthora fragariae]|uniref:Uncharacterized protein n=1 Tax=Phytophthora fragariae TaxID=53985 RepID=A0A6A3M9R1_9STRA|nr:hypothetical protein PF011_g3246 [Phytophthora fragariae]KAE9233688.1 hypothetical protein PF004_g9588 [Phytophthora fragariae]